MIKKNQMKALSLSRSAFAESSYPGQSPKRKKEEGRGELTFLKNYGLRKEIWMTYKVLF